MNAKSLELLDYARKTAAELSNHVVLAPLWNDLCVILKGSTSRGNADEYSDIDLVIYCDEAIRAKIVAGYHAIQLTDRQDGIFMLLANGHYHVESFDQLRGYFLQRDYLHCWDYQNAIVLHDPAGIYAAVVAEGKQALFAAPLPILKRAYLDLHLDLDWMRMPIQRGDGPSTLLHMAKMLGGISRMAYLLDRQPYPPDKWLFTFLPDTTFGREHGAALQAYFQSCPSACSLPANESYEQHPLYAQAGALLTLVTEHIRALYGEQPWLGPWYNYV